MSTNKPPSAPPGSSSTSGPSQVPGAAWSPPGSSVDSASVLPDDAAATVISPEQRWLGESVPVGPGSTLCGRLFPPLPQVVDGVAVPGSSVAVSPLGVELDHFIIDERIGVGGMGAVFRARDTRLGRSVALKVLSPTQSHDPSSVQRFRNEARAAAGLDHDNIARVFYVGEDRGLHFIAFEYVTGTNVRDLIAAKGPLDPTDAVNYALQIASALVHTKSVGVVHRDIKPSNIIITPSGRAKLVDLGLARNPELNQASEDLTSDGTTLGTFDYISPEQARDPRAVDVRSDIYSLGCTLYHMLTGEPPYPDGNAFQKLLDHQGKQPPDPARKNSRVSERLSAVVRRMMASDPSKRFSSPESLIRELMFVAEEVGLKGVSSEGMVWMSAGALSGSRWERHIGWMSPLALLLVVVVVLRYQPVDRSNPVPDSGDAVAITDGGTKTGGSVDSGDPGRYPSGDPAVDPSTLPRLSDVVGDEDTEATGVTRPGTPGVAAVPESPGAAVTASGAEGAESPGTVAKTANANGDGDTPKSTVVAEGNSRPSSADAGTTKPAVTATTRDTPPAVVVISADGNRQKEYPTLNAALVDAVDGSQIVLQYNGMRVESPVRVARKNITIRGAEGFRPGIEFRPKGGAGDGVPPRMITVTDGPLQVINAELRLVVPRTENLTLTLFSFQRPEQVRLREVVVTVVNPGRHQAAVIELARQPGAMPNMKKMMKEKMEPEPLELTLDRCIIRGNADAVHVRHADPAELTLNNCVVAVGGSLLHAVGIGGAAPKQRSIIDLELVHVSALLGQSLLRLDSGENRRHLPAVRANSRDSIYSHANDAPLVAMGGNNDIELFRGLLVWRNGQNNFFDDYSVFWRLGSDSDVMDFSGWKQQWGPAGSRNAVVGWQTPRSPGDSLAWDRQVLADFRLATDVAAENRPVATDGTDAGADLGLLPAITDRSDPDE